MPPLFNRKRRNYNNNSRREASETQQPSQQHQQQVAQDDDDPVIHSRSRISSSSSGSDSKQLQQQQQVENIIAPDIDRSYEVSRGVSLTRSNDDHQQQQAQEQEHDEQDHDNESDDDDEDTDNFFSGLLRPQNDDSTILGEDDGDDEEEDHQENEDDDNNTDTRMSAPISFSQGARSGVSTTTGATTTPAASRQQSNTRNKLDEDDDDDSKGENDDDDGHEENDDDAGDADEEENISTTARRIRHSVLVAQHRQLEDTLFPPSRRILGFSYEATASGGVEFGAVPTNVGAASVVATTTAASVNGTPRRRKRQEDENKPTAAEQQPEQQPEATQNAFASFRETSSMLQLRCFEPSAVNRRQPLLQYAVTPHARRSALGCAEVIVTFNEVRIALLCECIRYYDTFGCFVGLPDRCRVALHFVIVEERNLPWENSSGVPLIKSNASDVHRWCVESLGALLHTTFSTLATCAVIIRAAARPTYDEAALLDGVEPNCALAIAVGALACKVSAGKRINNGSNSNKNKKTEKNNQEHQQQQELPSDCSVMRIPTPFRRQARDALGSPLVDNPFFVSPMLFPRPAQRAVRRNLVVRFLIEFMDVMVSAVAENLDRPNAEQAAVVKQEAELTNADEAAEEEDGNKKKGKKKQTAPTKKQQQQQQQKQKAAKVEEDKAAAAKTATTAAAAKRVYQTISLDALLSEAARKQAVKFLRSGRHFVVEKLLPLLLLQQQEQQPAESNMGDLIKDEVENTQQQHHLQQQTLALNLSLSDNGAPVAPIFSLSAHLRGDADTCSALQRVLGGASSKSAASSSSSSSLFATAGIPSSTFVPLTLLLDAGWRVRRAVDELADCVAAVEGGEGGAASNVWTSICRLGAAIATPFVFLRYSLPFSAPRASFDPTALSLNTGSSAELIMGQQNGNNSNTNSGSANTNNSKIKTKSDANSRLTNGTTATTQGACNNNATGSLGALQVWFATQIRTAIDAGSPARSANLACLGKLPQLIVDLLLVAGRAAEYSKTTRDFFVLKWEQQLDRGCGGGGCMSAERHDAFVRELVAAATNEGVGGRDEAQLDEVRFFIAGDCDNSPHLFVGVWG